MGGGEGTLRPGQEARFSSAWVMESNRQEWQVDQVCSRLTWAGRDTLCLTRTQPLMEKKVKAQGNFILVVGKRNTSLKVPRPWAPTWSWRTVLSRGWTIFWGTTRQRLGFIIWPGDPGVFLQGEKAGSKLGHWWTFSRSPFSACHPGWILRMPLMLKGKLLRTKDADPEARVFIFLCWILAIFRFSCFSYFAVRIFFFTLFFSPSLPVGKCVSHISLECHPLFHPRAGVDLVLWGLKLTQFGSGPFKEEEYKNFNRKLDTIVKIWIWNEKIGHDTVQILKSCQIKECTRTRKISLFFINQLRDCSTHFLHFWLHILITSSYGNNFILFFRENPKLLQSSFELG